MSVNSKSSFYNNVESNCQVEKDNFEKKIIFMNEGLLRKITSREKRNKNIFTNRTILLDSHISLC